MSRLGASRSQVLWFVGLWVVSVVVVGGLAELLHRWIMMGSVPK